MAANPKDVFRNVHTVLVIDWPDKEVPELLARAGFQVVVHGGPGPEDYSAYEVKNGQVVARHVGSPPERADLVYSYRPLDELPAIIDQAKALHALTIWTQSGMAASGSEDRKGCWLPENDLERARELIQAAGLSHVAAPYIGDSVREMCDCRWPGGFRQAGCG